MTQVTAGLAQVPETAGRVPKAKLWVSPCEELCADLIAAIQRQPSSLEMRLEDALVMQESCAAELVSAARDAVKDDPTQLRLILKTALKLAPQRAEAIRAALTQDKRVMAEPMVQEEVRRAELPTGQTLPKNARAQLASELGTTSAPLEIRRAEMPDPAPEIEVRRAELPSGPRLKMTTRKRR
ncbi:MAG: hypothetical protein NTV80_04620 [Verrucomicrobia bacterium]|nr:hypothetical protein [Verrucomicrobiota bacterium]